MGVVGQYSSCDYVRCCHLTLMQLKLKSSSGIGVEMAGAFHHCIIYNHSWQHDMPVVGHAHSVLIQWSTGGHRPILQCWNLHCSAKQIVYVQAPLGQYKHFICTWSLTASFFRGRKQGGLLRSGEMRWGICPVRYWSSEAQWGPLRSSDEWMRDQIRSNDVQ